MPINTDRPLSLGQRVSPLALVLAVALVAGACASSQDPAGARGGDAGQDARVETDMAPLPQPYCGDGEAGLDEECDDGNEVDDDLCSNDCTRNPGGLCDPCDIDAHCGVEVDLCLDTEDGTFCARDCAAEGCPDGFECVEVFEDSEVVADQCVPESGFCGACPDADEDAVCDTLDRCPGADDLADDDQDGVADGCDVCAGGDDRLDTDDDAVPDACDACPGARDSDDADGDTVADGCDACPGADDRLDADEDAVPDACDVCGLGDDQLDADEDAVPDACDICGLGDDAADADSDTVPDACDICMGGNDMLDADADGVPDFCDRCEGGDDRLDADEDGVPDLCDVCAGGDDGQNVDGDDVPDFCDCDTAGQSCHEDASCAEQSTGVVCTCLDGFEGDGFECVDVNECLTGVDDCAEDAFCQNFGGGFACQCFVGLRGNGRACFPSTRVLIYHNGIVSRVDEAASRLALPYTYTTTPTSFYAAFDDVAHGLIVIDAPAGVGLPAPLRDRLADWVYMGGDLIFSYGDLDTALDLRAILGLGSVTDFTEWRDVYADPGSPLDLFEYMESVPSPLTGSDLFNDNGDELTLGGSGFLLARFDSAFGPGAIAVTRESRAIVNGFLLAEAVIADADADGLLDVQELIMNEMAVVLEGDGCEMVEGFEEGIWPNGFWTLGKDEPSYPGTVDLASARHGSAGIKEVGWFYESSETVGEPGDRVVIWMHSSSSGRAYLGFGAGADGARSFVAAPNTGNVFFQVNDAYNFSEVASASHTWAVDTWFRVEVEYLTASRMQGRVYDVDGNLLRSLTHDFGTPRPGGIAIRAFSGVALDSIFVCRP